MATTVQSAQINRDNQTATTNQHGSIFTFYRTVKITPRSEVEIVLRKTPPPPRWFSGQQQQEQQQPTNSAEKIQDCHHHSDDDVSKQNKNNNSVAPNVYLTILNGQAETFGISLNNSAPLSLASSTNYHQPLVPLPFDERFVLQTVKGCDICFLLLSSSSSSSSSVNVDVLLRETQALSQSYHRSDRRPYPASNFSKRFVFTPLNPPVSHQVDRSSVIDLRQLTRSIINKNDNPGGGGRGGGDFDATKQPSTFQWRIACNVQTYSSRSSSSSSSTPTWPYQAQSNFAAELNRERSEAASRNRSGPVVMLIGPTDAGKSTMAKVLLNYAINDQWYPMYVDLDVGQGSMLGVPGSIGAGIVERRTLLGRPYQFRGIDASSSSSSSSLPVMVHVGTVSPDKNIATHRFAVRTLAQCVEKQLRAEEQLLISQRQSSSSSVGEKQQRGPTSSPSSSSSSISSTTSWATATSLSSVSSVSSSSFSPSRPSAPKQPKSMLTKWAGVVINTHGWIQDYGYDSTLEAIQYFHVTHLVVIGDYRLYEQVHRVLLGRPPPSRGGRRQSEQSDARYRIWYFDRSNSAHIRNTGMRRKLRWDRFAHYFRSYTPVTVKFSHHQLYRFYTGECFAKFLHELQHQHDEEEKMTMIARNPHHYHHDRDYDHRDPRHYHRRSYNRNGIGDGDGGGGGGGGSGSGSAIEETLNYATLHIVDNAANNHQKRSKKRRGKEDSEDSDDNDDNDEMEKNKVIFYHLPTETLVYLLNRVLSLVEISAQFLTRQMSGSAGGISDGDGQSSSTSTSTFHHHRNNNIPLGKILRTIAFAYVAQIDLENEQLILHVPTKNYSDVANKNDLPKMITTGQVVALIHETEFDPNLIHQ